MKTSEGFVASTVDGAAICKTCGEPYVAHDIRPRCPVKSAPVEPSDHGPAHESDALSLETLADAIERNATPMWLMDGWEIELRAIAKRLRLDGKAVSP